MRAFYRCHALANVSSRHFATMTTSAETAPVLTISQGQVRGVRRKGVYDTYYYSFEGIPFGRPPLGELRFRAPQPAEAWTGVRNCSEICNKPVQVNRFTGKVEGSEDCLYLNVYVKTVGSNYLEFFLEGLYFRHQLDSEKPLPVMVWIYGGGFYKGEGSRRRHGPDYFMQKEVVMVSFNYRVCSLGFLSLADPELQVPGNAGLKDQVLALKWVKQNIGNFNGDLNNITVFGESAGGAAAHYMALTEQTRGLFHKVILQSGCALNYWANIPPADTAYRLATRHGYRGEDSDRQVLCFLLELEAAKLVTHDLLSDEDKRNDYLFLFAPTVEPYTSEDCIIPCKPLQMMQVAWSNEIPMILGGTAFEGLLLYSKLKEDSSLTSILNCDPERVLPVEVRESHRADDNQQMASKIICTHFGDREPNADTILEHLDLFSYKAFWHGFHRTALSRMAYASAPTYMYRFDFDSPHFNLYRMRYCGTDPVNGAAHADDLPYIFYFRESPKLSFDSAEYKTIQRMIAMWTAFARSSNPNCLQIEPSVWRPLKRGKSHLVLNISHEVEMTELPEAPKLEVWSSLYKREELF